MIQLEIKILYSLLFLIFVSCSNSQIEQGKMAERMYIVDMQAWINIMPGSQGSFHLTGEYQFDGAENEKPILKEIKVYSENKIIYEIDSQNFSNELQTEKKDQNSLYRFITQQGLKLNETIRTVAKIDIKLKFNFNNNLFEKIINDIDVTRAY
jgi:hypothetical protein